MSAIVCCNAGGAAKVDNALIDRARNTLYFHSRACPLKCFSQANPWSYTETFLKGWNNVPSRLFGGDGTQLAAVDETKRDRAKEPEMKVFIATLNSSSSRVLEATQTGSTNTECSVLLSNLDIAPGEPVNDAAIRAAQVWASLEDQDSVVKAMRADAEDITALLDGMALAGGGVDEEEKEENSDDESTDRGVGAPPAYAELSPHIRVLEKAAGDSGNGDAAFDVQQAKMAMIVAHASTPARQADMRDLF